MVFESRKSFCLICIANYCRSPVAENFLKNRFKDEYEFFSAGISPASFPNMDPRSLNFLKQNNVNFKFHNPKKINKKMLSYFDYFFAVDLFVLNELNKSYPKYKYKFKLFTSQFKDIAIIDPYKLSDDEYTQVMTNIKFVSENIRLSEI